VWNGSTWVGLAAQRWDGAGWVEDNRPKAHDGSQWFSLNNV
jgi:hypothetical protein